jgi:aspartate/methionine/tyrosine aminotransferase
MQGLRELFEALAAHKDYATICSYAHSEYLAALALRHRHAIIERNPVIIRRNDYLFTHRSGTDYETNNPIAFRGGGLYLDIDLSLFLMGFEMLYSVS